MFLKSVVNSWCSYLTCSSVCHRWSLYPLKHILHAFRTLYFLHFPPASLVSPQSPCLSLHSFRPLHVGVCKGSFHCPLSVYAQSLVISFVLFALSTICVLMTPKFVFPAQDPSTNSSLLQPKPWHVFTWCLIDSANVTCMSRTEFQYLSPLPPALPAEFPVSVNGNSILLIARLTLLFLPYPHPRF